MSTSEINFHRPQPSFSSKAEEKAPASNPAKQVAQTTLLHPPFPSSSTLASKKVLQISVSSSDCQIRQLLELFDPLFLEELDQNSQFLPFIEEIVLSLWPTDLLTPEKFKERISSDAFIQVVARNLLMEKTPAEIREAISRFQKANLSLSKGLSLVFEEVEAFAKNAEQYGYKGAYLIQLQTHTAKLPSKIAFEVPPFYPIAHDALNAWIFQNPTIKQKWDLFCELQGENKNTLTEKGIKALEDLQMSIKKVIHEIPHDNPLILHALEWLKQESQGKDTGFTCRSSSREDKKTTVNAGGNTTVPYFTPDASSLIDAMGEVVASYFSLKSFEQRLSSRDDIRKPPLLAVILQKRVGERMGGEEDTTAIVISGVANSKKGVKAVIHAHPGFGEKVVGGSGEVDRYYVLLSGKVHAHLHHKNTRFVSKKTEKGGISLSEKKLPDSLQTSSSLPFTIAKEIGGAVDYFQKLSGNARDLEFVYDPTCQKVFLVQDRPLPASSDAPHYVSEKVKSLHPEEVKGSSTIVYAQENVKLVKNPPEILLAKTLPQALDEYLEHPAKEGIKCICVNEEGGALSHPAVIFKGAEIPVLHIPVTSSLQKWIETPVGTLLIDPQETKIYFLKDNAERKDLEEQGVIVKGRTRYPCSDKVSLPPEDPLVDVLIPSHFAKDFFPEKDLKALVSMLRQEKEATLLKQAMYSIFFRLTELHHTVEVFLQDPHMIDEIKKSFLAEKAFFSSLIRHAYTFKQDLIASFSYPPNDLRRLASLHFFEQLLFQTSTDQDIQVISWEMCQEKLLSSIAFYRVLNGEIQAQRLSKKLLTDKDFLALAQESFSSIYSESLQLDFLQFIDDLRQSSLPEQKEELQTLFKNIRKEGLLNTFLNSCFSKTWSTCKEIHRSARPSACLKRLAEEWRLGGKTIKKIASIKKALDQFDPAACSTPSSFQMLRFGPEDTWPSEHSLMATVIVRIQSPQLKDEFTKTSLLGKQAILSLMHQFVTKYDAAIKTMKGNSQNKPEEILKVKAEALWDLLGVFEGWSYSPGYLCQKTLQTLYTQEQSAHLRRAFTFLEESKTTPANHLLPSKPEQFFLPEVVIGSGRHGSNMPETYEDLFMWLHQNLETLLSAIENEHFSSFLSLPSPLQNLVNALETAPFGTMSQEKKEEHPTRIYVHFTSEEVKLGYNLIVAHHSVTFTLYFPKKGKDMTLCVRYFGADEGQRWTVMGGIIHLFQLSGKVDIPSAPHLVYSFCGGIEYTINIPKNLSDFSEVQRLLTTAHQCATTYFATDLPPQICEQLIHPQGVFKTKEDLIEAVLTQDPHEAFSLYYFLAALVKSCKESADWNTLLEPLEKAISKLKKSSNGLLNMFAGIISTLIKS